ncbi:4-alpha-glucanotransferase [Dinoroseobacter sp. S124A]|uniref:4-alpha-glucanotransferase n=1 Tax=Dinoroseobacter sp. S124A TaxID=3415128 RepID=UPI003C79F3B4
MSDPDADLRRLAEAHGVCTRFHDLQGHEQIAAPDTLRALLSALGVPARSPSDLHDSLAALTAPGPAGQLPDERILLADTPETLALPGPCAWALIDEHGALAAEGRGTDTLSLPRLEIGYYTLALTAAEWRKEIRVLVRPDRAPGHAEATGLTQCWGVTGALYGLRSAQNGGLGSYADLGTLAEGLARHGAQFLGINPVHALGWAETEIISPYSPSHRGFLNCDHIALEGGLGPTPEAALIDYPAFRHAHRAALEHAYEAGKDDPAFLAWRAAADPDTEAFAQFEALSERHGAETRRWPAAARKPGQGAARHAGARADFHLWLQYKAETQIHAAQGRAKAAGMGLGLYLDLAVGPRPDGAEVWLNADTIATGVTIGAPPDHLSPEGQSWALAAHAPTALASAMYLPLRKILWNLMSTCGLLRIDHALGLMRSFWLPEDGSPGGYITQPYEALLAVISIEAARTGCVVIGEDLGLVPDGFRDKMQAAGLYSYAVWQFETEDDGRVRDTSSLPEQSMACFGTHDTPTISGFWHGVDIEWWLRVGWMRAPERAERHSARAHQRAGLREACGLAPSARFDQVRDGINRELAGARSAMVAVQLDDVFDVQEAQNLPGTIDAHPNWRRRLPVDVAEVETAPELTETAARFNARGPAKTRGAA